MFHAFTFKQQKLLIFSVDRKAYTEILGCEDDISQIIINSKHFTGSRSNKKGNIHLKIKIEVELDFL